MPCDQPNGPCTNASPCGPDCGCPGGAAQPEPIVPRCQDIVLTPGTYQRATVVVNQAGCIAAVQAGEPEAYTPDECCPGGSGSGGGLTGARGPAGDPGAAATIAVNASIPTGDTPSWTVQNVGTPSAAIFQFTAPAPEVVTPGTSGITGEVAGLTVDAGKVTGLPASLVTAVSAAKSGDYAGNFIFTATPFSVALPDHYVFTLNLDSFASAIIAATGVAALTGRVAAIEDALLDTVTSLFQVAAATGVNLVMSGTTIVPLVRVAVSPNIWFVGAAYDGATVTDSDSGVWAVTPSGQVTLPPLLYPIAIAPATP